MPSTSFGALLAEYGVAAFGDDALVPDLARGEFFWGRELEFVCSRVAAGNSTIRCGQRVRPFLPARPPPSGGAYRAGDLAVQNLTRTGRC